MRCSEIIGHLETLAPLSLACDWDNPGLLAGRSDKEVCRVFVALDATDEVIELAVRERADLILTHHPLIFSPLKKVNDQNFIAARILKLIQHDICCYAMHTNFDSAPGGMAALAAARLGLLKAKPLEPMGVTPDGEAYGIGTVGNLEKPTGLKELAGQVKAAFGLPFVTVYGVEEVTEPIRRVAVCPGSGRHMTELTRAGGASVLITGDVGHHDGIDAVAEGVAVIDGGHYGLEHIFADFMDTYIKERIDGELTVIKAPVKFPAAVF